MKNTATLIREIAKHTPELCQLIMNAGGIGAVIDYIGELRSIFGGLGVNHFILRWDKGNYSATRNNDVGLCCRTFGDFGYGCYYVQR